MRSIVKDCARKTNQSYVCAISNNEWSVSYRHKRMAWKQQFKLRYDSSGSNSISDDENCSIYLSVSPSSSPSSAVNSIKDDDQQAYIKYLDTPQSWNHIHWKRWTMVCSLHKRRWRRSWKRFERIKAISRRLCSRWIVYVVKKVKKMII